MISLIFTACSIVNGAQCREVTLNYEDVSLMTCQMQAQQPMAEWQIEHPNFTVGRYTCQIAGMYAKM